MSEWEDLKIYHSEGFREKPDAQTAQEYLLSGHYSWNAGLFIWKASLALAEFERQQPNMYPQLKAIHDAVGTPQFDQVLQEVWPTIPKIAIDYAIMEHAERMAIIPVDIGWSDIGSWSALYDVLSSTSETNGSTNIRHGAQGELLTLDSSGTLVLSNKLVVTIGLQDVVIVDTEDVLLVCHRNQAQEVRTIVKRLQEEGRTGML
jgi:mannose-1-phosphate guanylyltransferase